MDNLATHRLRSMQSVLADGFRLYAKNFWKILRSSWIQAIVYALVVGGSMTYFFTHLLPSFVGSQALMPALAIWLGSFVVFLVIALIFAVAGGFAPLKEHWQTSVINSPIHWYGRWPWKLTLRTPLSVVRCLLSVVKKRQLGMLIAVCCLLFVICCLLTVIFQLPAVIMAIADVEAQKGMAAGDAVDIPENMWLLNFATFSICGFIQAYIHLATLYPLYYIWRNTHLINIKHGDTEEQRL